jgi:hypothetical protein
VRIAAFVLGLVLFGGLIVLAVAGVTAATAVLLTAAAVVAMIGLGNAVGGRQTPNRAPYAPPTGDAGAAEDEEDAASDHGADDKAEDTER